MPLKLKSNAIAAHFGEGEFDGSRIAIRGDLVNDGAAGIRQAKKFAHFIKGFAGGIVAGFAEEFVFAGFRYFEEMSMAAADDQRQGWERDTAVLEQDRMDVTLDVVNSDKGQVARKAEGFSVSDSNQQGTDEAWA